jgi:integrase
VYDKHFSIEDDLPVPLMDETVFKYISNIKTFLTESKSRGYEVDPSYESWKVIKRKYPIVSLSEDELLAIEAVDYNSAPIVYKKRARKDQTIKAITIGRDYLTQECRTGARISDIKRFDQKDVKDMKWEYLPTKGDRENSVRAQLRFTGFSMPAWWIFQKYNFRMPQISEQKINDNIKLACKYAGIVTPMFIERWAGNMKIRIHGEKWEFISSHTGRKSFVTILGNKYKIPIGVLMQYTAIQDMKTIQHYLGESEDEVLDSYLDKAGVNTLPFMKKAN